MFCGEYTFNSICEEQFYLAKDCNISITETENLPDFERRLYSSFLIKYKKARSKNLNKNLNKI